MLPCLIITDTSCLIIFEKISSLYILQKTFEKIYTTPEVVLEFGKPLPAWIEIEEPENDYSQIAADIIDKGEASAIALATEFTEKGVTKVLLALDDLKARKFAVNKGLNIIGSMGIILKAKEEGVIPLVKPLFEKIRQTNFRINKEIEKSLLRIAGEL